MTENFSKVDDDTMKVETTREVVRSKAFIESKIVEHQTAIKRLQEMLKVF